MKLKNKIIKWLGGVPKEQYIRDVDRAYMRYACLIDFIKSDVVKIRNANLNQKVFNKKVLVISDLNVSIIGCQFVNSKMTEESYLDVFTTKKR